MVLDGSNQCEERIQSMISWDVNNGIARRAWANNPGSVSSIKHAMNQNSELSITLPNVVDEQILSDQYD